MPKAFLKINAEFTVKPGDNVDEDHGQLCAEVVETSELEIGTFDDEPNLVTTFSIAPSAMIEGNINISSSDDVVIVKAHGIAEVSVASAHMDTFLSGSGNWKFSGLAGPWLGKIDVDGLERIEFKTMRRGEEIDDHYWKLEVTTGKTKKL